MQRLFEWLGLETPEKPRVIVILVPHAACMRALGTEYMDAVRLHSTVDMLNHVLWIEPPAVRSLDARALIAALELKMAIMRLSPGLEVCLMANETQERQPSEGVRHGEGQFAQRVERDLPRLCTTAYVALAVDVHSFASRGAPGDVLMPRGHCVPANVYFMTRTGTEMGALDTDSLAFEEHRCRERTRFPRLISRRFGVRCIALYVDENMNECSPMKLRIDIAAVARWCISAAGGRNAN